MVATLAQAASAAYYLESQRSFRHPNEYYTAGEEPDGVWFNPAGLLGLENGDKVDSGDFHRLYAGFAPDGATRLTRNAGSENRSAGLDMTFSADKSVSALWAVADPDLRSRIEQAHNDAARVALEETVLRYCSYTRIRDREGRIKVLPADIAVAMFQHGTSRENDPQLHTHCVIFNAARTREDGKWRAMHQYPVYSWAKAAGAVYRNALAWNLRERLGIRMEQYGPNAGFTRIEGMPEDLQAFWSKRRKAIVAKAGELGIPSLGNASRMAGVNKLTRAGKSHDNDPEVRHRRWMGEAESFVEREELIAAITGNDVETGPETIRELTGRLDDLPAHLAREEAVFRRPDMVEAAANAAAGAIGPEALKTAIERLRRNPEIERLEPKKPTAESRAGMVHTEVYTTRHNLGLEQAVKDMAGNMAADTGHGLPEGAVTEKVEALMKQGYPLSQEQSLAIRHATVQGGRVAVIEGAAGSGKTTTLRPITDLHREHGYEIVPTAVAWRTAVALGDDCDARAFCVDKLLKLAAKGQVEIGRKTLIVVDEAGMLSTRQAHHILQLSEKHGAKVVFAGDTRQQQPVEAGAGVRAGPGVVRGRRASAAAGGGGAGAAADPGRGRQRPRRPHQAPEGGSRGRADPRAQGDPRAGALPGRSHEPAGARRHSRGLRGDGAQAGVHAVAGGGVGGAQGRGGGEGDRGMAPAQPASPLSRRGEDAHPSGGRLGAACAHRARHVHRRARAHEGRGTGAVVAHEGARAGADTRGEARGDRGEPGPGRAPDGAAGDRGRRPAPHRRHAVGQAALQRHGGHRREPGNPTLARRGCVAQGPEPASR